MSMIIDGTNGLTFNNSTTQASAGSVIQTVSAVNTSATTTSSGTFVTTGFSVSITPKFSTSKIFVSISGGYARVSSSNNFVSLTIYRNSTNLGAASRGLYQAGSSTSSGGDFPVAMSYYDSPATTSSTTYTIYIHTDSGTSSFGLDSCPNTLTVMEIAA
jgi:hypothetical protein